MTKQPSPHEPHVDAVVDENGVDRSLIRWFLALSPAERLAALDEHVKLAEAAERGRESAR